MEQFDAVWLPYNGPVADHRAAPIILIEDDRNDRFFVSHALDKARIVNPLISFDSAREAREHFSEGSGFAMPALCIIDVHLVGAETGIQFLRWLRQQRAPLGTTPVMMLTGSESAQDRDEADVLGSIYFLRKPVSEASLTAAVESLGFVLTAPTGLDTERTIARHR